MRQELFPEGKTASVKQRNEEQSRRNKGSPRAFNSWGPANAAFTLTFTAYALPSVPSPEFLLRDT